MTILELFFSVDRVREYESYNKPYDYWSIDESDTFLFLTYRDSMEFLTDRTEVAPEDIYIECFVEHSWRDVPPFISYEMLKPYDTINIEFEKQVEYEAGHKYPLVCVRGMCDKHCGNKDIHTYCFHDLPCFNGRPDWNCYSTKYPDFFCLLFSVVDWIKECKGVDALVVMFTYVPCFEPDLCFRYCTALHVHRNNIKVIKDVEKMYNEYNKKYPTEDREIEYSISRPEDDFYFKF